MNSKLYFFNRIEDKNLISNFISQDVKRIYFNWKKFDKQILKNII